MTLHPKTLNPKSHSEVTAEANNSDGFCKAVAMSLTLLEEAPWARVGLVHLAVSSIGTRLGLGMLALLCAARYMTLTSAPTPVTTATVTPPAGSCYYDDDDDHHHRHRHQQNPTTAAGAATAITTTTSEKLPCLCLCHEELSQAVEDTVFLAAVTVTSTSFSTKATLPLR